MLRIIKFSDRYIGSIICRLFGAFTVPASVKDYKLKKAQRILIIQLWGIGESILTLPAINALRKKFPDAEIDIAVTSRNKEVYSGIKDINKIIALELSPKSIIKFIAMNFKRYDLVIDMEEYLNISSIISFFSGSCRIGYSHNARSKLYNIKVDYNDKQHASLTFLDLVRVFGAEHEKEGMPQLIYSSSDKKNVDRILRKYGIGKGALIVGVAPGAAESAKCRMWPYERYAELCSILIEVNNATILFAGTKEEDELVKSIMEKIGSKKAVNLAGRLSLKELFYFVTKCRIFIANDAGAMHIAAAQGTKTIGLFGPNLPVRFGPYGKGNVGIYKGYNCQFSPCINVHKGEVPDCLYPKSSSDYQKCMKNISVNEVLVEIEKLM